MTTPKKRKRFKTEEGWSDYSERERERMKVNARLNYEEKRAKGICVQAGCKNVCQINFVTNKLFAYCGHCRAKERQRQKDRRNSPNVRSVEASIPNSI